MADYFRLIITIVQHRVEECQVSQFDSKKFSRAIFSFILLDLSVLAINFWIASEVAHYAVSINLAGRQRMLSQRITKTLLQLHQPNAAESSRTIENELRDAIHQFDQTLSAFESGGTVVGSDGRLVALRGVEPGQSAILVSQALRIWKPVRENILPFTGRETPIPHVAIELMGKQMLQNNLQLLDLMNRLASNMESDSTARANMLQRVQAGVFFLALLNFLMIVRRLHGLSNNAFKLSRHFAELAIRDPLTGLFNRREFDDALEREFASARRRKGSMAVLLMDLDGFKQVNDTNGHEAGDTVLCTVAARISEVMRANDTVARIGGDEFMMICPDMSDERHAAILSQRLIDVINQPIELDATSVSVGASIGIAFCSDRLHGAEELIREADQAMYTAKKAGRNRYVFASVFANSDWPGKLNTLGADV